MSSTYQRSKAQKRNNREFQAKLDKITNYLVEADWHTNYTSRTVVTDGIINNSVPSDAYSELEFFRTPGGGLRAEVSYIGRDGNLITEETIVGVQPFEKTFYMIELANTGIGFGKIDMRSGNLRITLLETFASPENSALGIYEYTRSAAHSI